MRACMHVCDWICAVFEPISMHSNVWSNLTHPFVYVVVRAQKGQSNSLLAESFQSPSLKRSMPHLNDSLSSSAISVSETPKRKYVPHQKKRLVNGDSFEEDHTVVYASCYPSTLAFSDHLNPLASEERRLSVGSEEVNSCQDQDEIIISECALMVLLSPCHQVLLVCSVYWCSV